jgi:hypothetical protein
MNSIISKASLAVAIVCACGLSIAQESPASTSSSATESEVFIKASPAYATKQFKARRVWLAPGIPGAQYNKEIVELANLLAGDKLDADEQKTIDEGIKREPARAGAAFGALLDWKHYGENTRRGALRGIQISAAPARVVGKSLGASALSEPDAKVRSATIDLIKERKDAMAAHTLLGYLAAAADNTGLGIINEKQRNAALAALQEVGDKRVYEILLYYVTLEVRAGYAASPVVTQAFITNSGDVNNGGPPGGAAINLPIDLPSLELGSFQGTIVVPAIADPMFSLKRATGQDFGKDLGKWKKWIDEQPAVRK